MLAPHYLLISGPLTQYLLALTWGCGFPLLKALPDARCDNVALSVDAIAPCNSAVDAVQRVAQEPP